ncbi:MAG: alpha/beta hydrolase, partial [Actinomycetota bacterium]|nr:alpha/beta hydrolase [Actinomycetota bacterium]
MRYRTPAPPARIDAVDGLAYSLWLPEGEPAGGVVIVHGADSQKESHHDFARLLRDAGLAAVCFDLRGHGASPGPLDGRLLADVATVAGVLPPGPVALRGS